jgi:hypothetical protein
MRGRARAEAAGVALFLVLGFDGLLVLLPLLAERWIREAVVKALAE